MMIGDEKPLAALIDCSGWLSSLAWLVAAQNSLTPYKEEIEALARMAASVSARCGTRIFCGTLFDVCWPWHLGCCNQKESGLLLPRHVFRRK